MGTISVQRTLCEALPQAMTLAEISDSGAESPEFPGEAGVRRRFPDRGELPRELSDVKARTSLCAALKNSATDAVTYALEDQQIRFVVENRSTGQPATLFLDMHGQLSEQGLQRHSIANVGQSAAVLLYNGLLGIAGTPQGVEQSMEHRLLAAATRYFTCLNQRDAAQCVASQQGVVQLVQAKRAQAVRVQQAAEAQAQEWRLTAVHDEAVKIWAKVDAFIAQAKARDNNDSDLDVLLAIRQRWEPFRAGARPSTYDAAATNKQRAKQLWSELTSSPHLQSLVLDEGSCRETVNDTTACGYGQRGQVQSGIRSCTLGEFTFSISYSKDNCREVPDGIKY